MLSKEKTLSLNKYLVDLKNRQSSAIPFKHLGHPNEYKHFLQSEIKAVQSKLDSDKLEVGDKK